MFFAYKAMTREGSVKSGEIESTSQNEALRALTEKGLVPFEVSQRQRIEKPTARHDRSFARFARGLGQLLDAGIDIQAALLLMERSEKDSEMTRRITRLRQRVSAGTALSLAVKECEFGAPDYVSGLLRAGEASSQLGQVWLKIAAIEERRLKVREEIRAALLYPAFLLVIALASVALILLVVAPALQPILRGAESPPAEVETLLAAANWLQTHWVSTLIGLLIFLCAISIWVRTETGRILADKFAIRLPGIGRLLKHRDAARFLTACALMIKAGMALPEALAAAARASGNTSLRARLSPLSEDVRDGKALSTACLAHAALPETAVRMISVGEETGSLPDMMTQAALVLDQEGDRLQKTLISALTPTLTLILGVVVGGVVLTMLTAIMSVNSAGL